MRDTLTRTEVMRRYDLSAAALLEFERHGLLRPDASPGGRAYTAQDCLRIEVVLKARRLNFSFEEVVLLVDACTADGSTIDSDAGSIEQKAALPDLLPRGASFLARYRPSRRQGLFVAFWVALAMSFFVIEIVDPAPMDVMARHANCEMSPLSLNPAGPLAPP